MKEMGYQVTYIITKQLKELQRYMRDLNIASKELFEKYGKEYQ